MEKRAISNRTLKRLPLYLGYIKGLTQDDAAYISATSIAEGLGLNEVQVRKDLALVGSGGRPKVGYVRRVLIEELERFLGYDEVDSAVLVGVGSLGRALLCYKGFDRRGLDIVAAFDVNERLVGTEVGGKPVLAMEEMRGVCERLGVKIGIVTVPDYAAQDACDQLVACGVLAIWNFASVRLSAPDDILIQNENMESSLAILSTRLAERLASVQAQDEEQT